MRYLSEPLKGALLQTLWLAVDRYDGASRVEVVADEGRVIIIFPGADDTVWPFDIVLAPGNAALRVHLIGPDGGVERTVAHFRLTQDTETTPQGDPSLDLDRTYILLTGLLSTLRPHVGDGPFRIP